MDEKAIEGVKKIVETVSEKHGIDLEEVIVFGSRATEDYKTESDIDILIVSDDFADLAWNKRPSPFYEEWDYEHLPVPEFICLTPEEFDEKKERKPDIVRTAVQTGVKVKSK